jgi:wobble nucleotide-excising tRNase
MRRILEHYFQLLGGVDKYDLYKDLDWQEKIVCRSLLYFINDGSHSITDDCNFTLLDNDTIDKYLEVFRKIFENQNQIGHYNMMMKIKDEPNKLESVENKITELTSSTKKQAS